MDNDLIELMELVESVDPTGINRQIIELDAIHQKCDSYPVFVKIPRQ